MDLIVMHIIIRVIFNKHENDFNDENIVLILLIVENNSTNYFELKIYI